MYEATIKQKEFLRVLGQKKFAGMTKKSASELIDQLLAVERASGKEFSCPYCKATFFPRPKGRKKRCKSCSQMIIQICGQFYTEKKAIERDQKIWEKEERYIILSDVRDNWHDEKELRREGCKSNTGIRISVGANCPHASFLDNKLVSLEEAYVGKAKMLPPFPGCRYDSCECEVDFEWDNSSADVEPIHDLEIVSASRVDGGYHVVVRPTNSGCAFFLLLACTPFFWAVFFKN